MQVDGEPCRLAPAMIRISLRNQANMVQKSKRRTSMPLLNEWVCPPLWTRRPCRAGHWACAWSEASPCWERRKVQETQLPLGLSHISSSCSLYGDHTLLSWVTVVWYFRLMMLFHRPSTWVYIDWDQPKIIEWFRVIKPVWLNVFSFILGRPCWPPLLDPGHLESVGFSRAEGWQNWVLAYLSPCCIPFCLLADCPFPNAPSLESYILWCFDSVLPLLESILLSNRWDLSHDSMPKENVPLLDPFLSQGLW